MDVQIFFLFFLDEDFVAGGFPLLRPCWLACYLRTPRGRCATDYQVLLVCFCEFRLIADTIFDTIFFLVYKRLEMFFRRFPCGSLIELDWTEYCTASRKKKEKRIDNRIFWSDIALDINARMSSRNGEKWILCVRKHVWDTSFFLFSSFCVRVCSLKASTWIYRYWQQGHLVDFCWDYCANQFCWFKKKKICWSHCCYTVGKHIFGLQLRVKIKIHIFV